MKIRLFALVIAMLSLLSMTFLTASASNTLEITTNAVEGERGDTVEVVLTVESNPGFSALLINIPKTEGFEVVGYINGSVMKQMSSGLNVLWDSAYDSTATGTLLTVKIKIGEKAQAGENVINVRVYECFDEDQKAVGVTISSVKITVLGEPLPPEDIETDSDTTVQNGPSSGNENESDKGVSDGKGETTDPDNGVQNGTEANDNGKQDTDTQKPDGEDVNNENTVGSGDGVQNGDNVTEGKNDATEVETEVNGGSETESAKENGKPADTGDKKPSETDETPKIGGCGSSVGFGTVIIAVFFGAITFFRKKKDII